MTRRDLPGVKVVDLRESTVLSLHPQYEARKQTEAMRTREQSRAFDSEAHSQTQKQSHGSLC